MSPSVPVAVVPRTLEPGGSAAVRPPGAGEPAHLWWLRVPEHAPHLPGGLALLDSAEAGRYHGFARQADRVRYGCAHVGLRRLLAGYTGADPRRLAFARLACPTCGGPHGRPVLDGYPAPRFSLSHSGDLVLIAVAAEPVGADVETLPPLGVVDDVSPSLHPREAAELAVLPGAARRAAFARCWTRKEAYLKGTGEGLAATAARDYLGTGPAPASPPGWRVADCRAPDGYAAAVAVALRPDAAGDPSSDLSGR